MKLPYAEGTVFLVPLRNGDYARGVVARASEEGKAIFGYFFGPRLSSPDDVVIDDIRPNNAIMRIMFGDLGLINGDWKILGMIPRWNRTEWTMPDFVRRAPFLKPVLVRHSDTDPIQIETEIPLDEDCDLESDSLFGYGAVEIKLTHLLREATEQNKNS